MNEHIHYMSYFVDVDIKLSIGHMNRDHFLPKTLVFQRIEHYTLVQPISLTNLLGG